MKRGEKTFIDPCLFLPVNDLLIQRDIYIFRRVKTKNMRAYEISYVLIQIWIVILMNIFSIWIFFLSEYF